MNSEELEKSLRTEFDGYLKNVLAELRQEVSGFQEKVEAEIEKHKSQLEAVFQEFSTRVEAERELDESFTETVVEHLRLARDEGARITAEAIAEAEQMQEKTAPPLDYSVLRDAIDEISNQESQAEILKSLVNHAAQFTPRGAFFIIKNDYFVGWRVFGTEAQADEQAVREVFFPVANSTILGEAVRNLKTTEGAFGNYEDNSVFLNKLDFGQPDRMYAIPLVARGRGVAVLYADYGQEGTRVDIEALETLVRVAGLTVELLAASRTAKAEAKQQAVYSEAAAAQPKDAYSAPNFESRQVYSPPAHTEQSAYESPETFQEKDKEPGFEFSYQSPAEENTSVDFGFTETEEQQETAREEFQSPYDETPSWSQPVETVEDNASGNEPSVFESDFSVPAAEDYPSSTSDYQFDAAESYEQQETQFDDYSNQQQEAPQYKTNGSYASPVTDDFSTSESSFDSSGFEQPPAYTEPSEPVVQPSTPSPLRTRFSERNTDLPIEVTEDERRLHNDARRFARLLVSEIKLYNEQKVKEGREAQDLYERLREAIDRSREMYDKRVQPPVASKFDYFHYELVNTLAEGDESRLGSSYPGAEV